MIVLGKDRCFGQDFVPPRPLQDDRFSVHMMAREFDRSIKHQEQVRDAIPSVEEKAALRQPAFTGPQGPEQLGYLTRHDTYHVTVAARMRS